MPPAMADSFYVPDGDWFAATELTRGPWDRDSQHAGPPAALIGRAIEQLGGDKVVGSVSLDILRPVPITRLKVEARVLRPGRSVELVEASLSDDQDELVHARAWRIAHGPEIDAVPGEPAPPGPTEGSEEPFFPIPWDVGYHTAMEWRFARGAFLEPGPATIWLRMRHPLVPGESPTPLQRVLIAADTGNGASGPFGLSTHTFVNTDLSVHLFRHPEGEWVCLDAVSLNDEHGLGLAESALYDERGRVGRGAQTLLVRPRR
jgi:Acyl-CoA thioesterase C-terminal domain/Acyl-CoA thioesterase N-terminal domain